MESRSFPIDWRRELAQLQPFLDGKGGVACVRYDGQRCAPNKFIATLTSVYEGRWDGSQFAEASGTWRSLRIDPENYKMRYLSDIRKEFARKLMIQLPLPVTPGQSSGPIQVASNNTAGGAQTFHTSVEFHGDHDAVLAFRRDAWIQALRAELEQFLRGGHFMVILVHGSKEEQREFWDDLWHGGMSDLLPVGLFLVRMIDRTDTPTGEHHRAAAPDVEITLPLDLGAEQQADAMEDIANWISRRLPVYTYDQAWLLAKGIVIAHADRVDDLHSSTGLMITRLQQELARLK